MKEVPEADGDISLILANDLDATAVEAIQRNISFNGLDASVLKVNHGDAKHVTSARLHHAGSQPGHGHAS